MKKNIDKAFKSTVATYASTIVTTSTGFAVPIILVRYLSVESFGSYKLIMSLLVISSVATSFGLQAVIGRYVPDLLVNKRYNAVNKILFISCLTRFFAAFLFVVCLWVFRDSIFNFLNLPEIFFVYFIPISIFIIITLTNRIIGPAFLNALMEQQLDSYNNIAYAITKLISFWTVLYLGFGLQGLILAWLGTEILSFLYYAILAIKRTLRFSGFAKKECNQYIFESKRFMKYGLFHFMSSNLVIFHDLLIDNLVISKYLTVGMVGIYGLAGTIIGMATMLDPGKILKSIFSTILIGKFAENNNVDVVYKGYNFLNKVSLFLFLPAMVGLLLVCDKLIIYLYNPDYIEATNVLYIIIPFFVFQALLGPLSQVINIYEKNRLMLLCGISSIYNLVMDLVLVRHFGILGVAFATGSAMLLLYLLYFLGIRYYYKEINFPIRTIAKVTINLIPMAFFVFFARPYIVNMYMILVVILISIVLYFATTYKNKIFNEEERSLINRVLRRKICIF